jgi:hypothetical protein
MEACTAEFFMPRHLRCIASPRVIYKRSSHNEAAGMNRKKLRCLGGPLDGQFVEDGDAPTIFLEKRTGDESLELVTDHHLPPAMVHYRKIRIQGEGGEHADYRVADGMTFDDDCKV